MFVKKNYFISFFFFFKFSVFAFVNGSFGPQLASFNSIFTFFSPFSFDFWFCFFSRFYFFFIVPFFIFTYFVFILVPLFLTMAAISHYKPLGILVITSPFTEWPRKCANVDTFLYIFFKEVLQSRSQNPGKYLRWRASQLKALPFKCFRQSGYASVYFVFNKLLPHWNWK